MQYLKPYINDCHIVPQTVGKEEKPMKKRRVIGSVDQNKDLLAQLDPHDFSDDDFEGFALYQRSDGKPVIVLVGRSGDPMVWRIVDGGCDFYFKTFGETEEFCKARGYRFVK